jgi:hypothetical protein
MIDIKKIRFIEKANSKHNMRYDYSLINYINSRTKVVIICDKHGEFEQEPANHLRGQGCPKCAGVKNSTKDEFITKANMVHNNKYDYSLTQYVNNKTKVKIICPEHGEFEARPDNHLNNKTGCPKCANNILYTIKDFIEKAKIIHNNKYDYSKVNYITAHKKIIIICPVHGEFEQEPTSHLLGIGCSKCSGKYNYTNEEYIIKVKEIHNNKYDYSLTQYNNCKEKIKIICPIHGEFEQNAGSHINGKGCQKCYHELRTYDTEKFIKISENKHGKVYDYSLVNYEHSRKKIRIICPKHGFFEQIACAHLRGVGCPACKSSKGEQKIRLYLEKNNIKFTQQYCFDNCKNENKLRFDFYLPKYNMCIEYDGLQHFKPIEYFGGEKNLKIIKRHDNIKNNFCLNNNVKLIRIKYNENILKSLDNIFIQQS